MAYRIEGARGFLVGAAHAPEKRDGLQAPPDALLHVDNLHTYFETRRGIIKAVDGVSFFVRRGRTLGIVGESGCGKSACAMSIMQLLDSGGFIAGGRITLDGRDLTTLDAHEMRGVRGREISAVFQEPLTSLNPIMSIRHQLSESITTHTPMPRADVWRACVSLLEDVRIPDAAHVLRKYPFMLSGGMRQRVMIAMALAQKPALLIADEPTTALDVTIAAQILRLMSDLKQSHNTSIIFITHNLAVVNQMADDVAIMYCGQIVEMAGVDEIFSPKGFSHPYTAGLLASMPTRHTSGRLQAIRGSVPHPLDIPAGCRFRPRCNSATRKCEQQVPELTYVSSNHYVRCFNPVNKAYVRLSGM